MKDYDGQEVMFTSCFLNDYISVIFIVYEKNNIIHC